MGKTTQGKTTKGKTTKGKTTKGKTTQGKTTKGKATYGKTTQGKKVRQTGNIFFERQHIASHLGGRRAKARNEILRIEK